MPTTTETWNGSTADWNTANDWSDHIVPNDSSTNATLGGSGGYTVSIATGESFTTGTVLLDNASATLAVSGTLDPTVLTVQAGLFSVSRGTLAVGGASTNSGYLELENAAAATFGGNFANSGNLYVDNDNGSGGSTLTVSGTLTSSDYLQIGNGNLSASSTVTATALTNSGAIHLYGSADHQALLDITAGGAPATLVSGADLELYGNSLIEFASGGVTTIASGAELLLNGADAFVADAGTLGSNSALTGLTGNAGHFELDN
ncbi:MAG: hypothetical protein JO001_08310, partial [Alphaproteobacteria bacterium]|nr:hypothetical protein [Alphaproteobacteria bacterium]